MAGPGVPELKPIISPELCAALNEGQIVASDVGATIPGVTPATARQFLLEAARAVAAGALEPSKLPVALAAAGLHAPGGDADAALAARLADALWLAWVEVEDDPAPPEPASGRTRLAAAAKEAVAAGAAPRRALVGAGDARFAHDCGLVGVEPDAWGKAERRINTRGVYLQHKFNLMREESEGYAKAAVLLHAPVPAGRAERPAPSLLAELRALVGQFDLDPNRVCSLVIGALAARPSSAALAALAPAFSADAVAQLLGWEFRRYAGDAAEGATPPGLYDAAARLVGDGHVPLDALLAHLSPADDALAARAADAGAALKAAVARIGVISLTGGGGDGGGGSGGGGGAGEPGAPPRRPGQSAAALELDAVAFAARSANPAGPDNQKLLLLAALLRAGRWAHARALMQRLAALGLDDFGALPPVGAALCAAVAAELAPQYARLHPGGLLADLAAGGPQPGGGGGGGGDAPPPPAERLPHFGGHLLELLRCAGHHLYHGDAALLARLARCARAVLAAGAAAPAGQADAALDVLARSVLPAAALVPSCAPLVLEVWDALRALPYEARFRLYAGLADDAAASPLLTAAGKLAETEARRILRRVTAPASRAEAKVTMRPLGRTLAKVAHAQPLAVADALLRAVMGMPGMVRSVSQALAFLTPAAHDVLTFAVLRTLAAPERRKLKPDGVNLEEWFQWLAAFSGALAKRHADVELRALLQYVANQLKQCESLDLLVLKEVVGAMTGVAPVFEVSEAQLGALAGSATLVHEAVAQAGAARASDRSHRAGVARLLAVLREGPPQQQLAVPLLVLLAQQRRLITLQPQSGHLKLVAELYDKCHEVLLQYAAFLQHALTPAEYAAALPSLEDLATEFRVDPEVVFELHRPVLRDVQLPAPPPAEGGAAAGAAPAAGDAEDGELEDAAPPGGAPGWPELERQLGALAPAGGFRGMSPALFAQFWALALPDLEVPTARYEATVAALRAAARAARDDIDASKREAAGGGRFGGGGYGGRDGPRGGGGGPAVDVEQLAKEAEHAEAALERLPGELAEQQARAARVDAQLRAGRDGWVVARAGDGALRASADFVREFVQHCLLPRVTNSPADALFCARFLRATHALAPRGVQLLNVIDRVLREFGFLVRVATPREATNLGIFFNELLTMVERWRSADVFAAECAASGAFTVVSRGSPCVIPLEQYRKLTSNWQRVLTEEVSLKCLEGGDYMQAKNALLLLNRTVRVFPATRGDAQQLLRALAPIRDADPREDLKTLARMYSTALNMQLRDKARAMAPSRAVYAGSRAPPPKKRAAPPAAKPVAEAMAEELALPAEGGGPPPGFAAGKGPRGGAAAAAAAAGRDARGRPAAGRDGGRDGDRQQQQQQQQQQRPGSGRDERPPSREERRPAERSGLRADAPAFQPAGASGRDVRRGAPEPASDRDAKRQCGQERAEAPREEGRRGEPRREDGRRDEPRRDDPRRDAPKRRRSEEREPPSRPPQQDRERERERAAAAVREAAEARAAARAAQQPREPVRGRGEDRAPPAREQPQLQRSQSRGGGSATAAEAAVPAALAELQKRQQQLQAPKVVGPPAAGTAAAAAPAPAPRPASSGGSSSGGSGRRGDKRQKRRDRKKDRRESRRDKSKRRKERQGSPPEEERDSKRRRTEAAPASGGGGGAGGGGGGGGGGAAAGNLPERLRGRLGPGGDAPDREREREREHGRDRERDRDRDRDGDGGGRGGSRGGGAGGSRRDGDRRRGR